MSSTTIWPVPNQAKTRSPSVTGVGVARLCFSWRSGNGPRASTRYSHRRRPSLRLKDSTTRKAASAAARRIFAPPSDRLLARDQRGVIPRQHRMRPALQARPANLRCDEHLIAPDDGRRGSEAAQRRAPRDVLARAPRRRETRFARHAEPGRTAPLRPVRSHRRRGQHDLHVTSTARMMFRLRASGASACLGAF